MPVSQPGCYKLEPGVARLGQAGRLPPMSKDRFLLRNLACVGDVLNWELLRRHGTLIVGIRLCIGIGHWGFIRNGFQFWFRLRPTDLVHPGLFHSWIRNRRHCRRLHAHLRRCHVHEHA